MLSLRWSVIRLLRKTPMLPTPDLSHLSHEDYLHVYEPAEDTFALLDALEVDAKHLLEHQALICLEIGSGSGCVSSFLAKIIGPSKALFLCTDINSRAAVTTESTGRQNQTPLDAVITDLASSFRLQNSIDILIFNPPYVPTNESELLESTNNVGIANSWAGGKDGMDVTNRVLDLATNLLNSKGRFYLVCVADNKPAEIMSQMHMKGFQAEVGFDTVTKFA